MSEWQIYFAMLRGFFIGTILGLIFLTGLDYINENNLGLAGVFLDTIGAYDEMETLQPGDSVVVSYGFRNEVLEVKNNNKEEQFIVLSRGIMTYGAFHRNYIGLLSKNED